MIYGLGERPPSGNLLFKKTSEDAFLQDLATCHYVITDGGHSLVSEALYLGKPVLCHPIKLFYEQFFNAYFLKENGFGDYSLDDACLQDIIKVFEAGVDQYRARIAAGNFYGNKLVAARLNGLAGS